jgi:PDZ domain-containing protein
MFGTPSMARRTALIAIGILLVVAGAAYVLGHPSDEFVLLPDHPHPAAAIVDVQGESAVGDTSGPGIYYLDVLVHRATIGETWLAPLQSDVQTIAANRVIPPAGSQGDVARLDQLDVQSSKRLAGYVALRALGRKVSIESTGIRVDAVDPAAPAHAAGLAAGMVVQSVDGSRVRSLAALRANLARRKAGQVVQVGVLDGSKRRTLSIRLTTNVQAPGRVLLGVDAAEDVARVILPITVKIDTGNLGGPSAGLAFTLEIYDALTGRALSRGRYVAATGEIDQAGDVGLVGGIKGKTIGARRRGFDLMLVPKAEAGTARLYAGGHMRVIGVKTFADALAALRK